MISKITGKAVLFFEGTILPIVYGNYTLSRIIKICEQYTTFLPTLVKIGEGKADIAVFCSFTCVLTEFTLVFLNAFAMLGLIIHRNLYRQAHGFLEITVPLLATFFGIFFNYLYNIPYGRHSYVLPEKFMVLFFLAGSIVSFVGWTLSAIAIYNMRYSYSVFVEVRDITTQGLYKYVRHPIYLGYITAIAGLCLLNPYPAYITLSLVYIGLLIFRAALEERKLIQSAPCYKIYAQKTPFLFPRIFNFSGFHTR